MAWTGFWDMHSGGGLKEAPYSHIYIELPPVAAVRYFYSRFGHNPNRVSCTCCGADYSVSPSEWEKDQDQSLEELTAYQRDAEIQEDGTETYGRSIGSQNKSGKPLTIEEYAARENVLVIRTADLDGWTDPGYDPPETGWVWQG